ncbi:hypothetical protein BCF74_12314 [Knoellia remsis]|uniref:RadC-like JAB domain-containing protein n=1 Tax=Knoellia remsis TaxID=407159 RepID=A0A2T0UA86_9MICO|nr:hypothetical protein [Knoellia remsis]PRY54840.1 hypothetical protein BCF74_12314 [Knoellia remsis]
MTFENLPQNFRDLSLDDPVLRGDAVDLFVGLADRENGCLSVVLLDADHRALQPIVIGDMGPAIPESVRYVLRTLLEETRPPAVVITLGRDGSPLFTDTDRAVHQVAVDTCRELDITLLGTYVATEHCVRELPDHLRLAS